MTSPKTIFLIDDDTLMNYVHQRIIETSYPCNIVVFTSSYEALERLKQYPISESDQFPEIIFLDINMPHMDGWEFLEALQKLPDPLLAKCNVIMLTSSIAPCDIEKSKTYKVVKEFISKPLTVDKFKSLNQKIANLPR